MTYYILCTITYIISYPVPISCLLSCSGCYAIHFLHIVLSYIFLYDLILSYTLHLRFHSYYRIDIHNRFERESHHVCHSLSCTFQILYFPMIFIYCVFHILYFHIICHIHFVSLTLYFLYLYTGHILFSFIYCTCSYTFHVLYFVFSIYCHIQFFVLFIYFHVLCTFHILSYFIYCHLVLYFFFFL